MVNYPTPKNVKQVRSFIGLCSHYRNFVSGFNLIAEPLIKLTRSTEEWVWGDAQERAFRTLKDRMVQSPVLAHPDWSKPFYLQTDASKYGAGAVLAQKDDQGKFHPIAYSSWLFDNAQRNYSTTERELLAIVLATRKWGTYLRGTHCLVETDHKPLAGKWDWKDPYGKITRWADELRRYNLSITYVKGKDNEHADAFSRAFMEEVFAGISWELVDHGQMDDGLEVILSMTTEEIEKNNYFKPASVLSKEPVTDLHESILSLCEDAIPSDQDWAKAQREDDWYKMIIRWIEAGELPNNNKKAKEVLGVSAQFSLDPYTGVLMKNTPDSNPFQLRRCVPKKFRKLIVALCHDSEWVGAHMGRNKTVQRVSEKFYFPRMSKYIEAYVAVCPACQCSKHAKNKPKIPIGTIEANGVWDLVCIDLWKSGVTSKKGNKYVLTVVDAFSKLAVPIAIPSKKAEVVAKALMEVISDKGPMRRLHSDQGKEFCNEVIDKLCDLFHVSKQRTTAYHPMGNGFAERIHQFYRSAITSFVNSSGSNWDEFLPALKLAYNSAMHSALGVSPFEVFYGRRVDIPGFFYEEPKFIGSGMTYNERLKWVMYKTQELIFEKRYLDEAKKRSQQVGLEIPTYEPGERVKMEIPRVKPGASKKLKYIWSGPWEISRQGRNPKVYYLKDDMGRELTNPISVSRLLPWNSPGDFPILEDEIPDQPLVLVGSTGDLMDQGSESEEDNGAAMADDPDDPVYEPSQVEEPPKGSNPAKKKKAERPVKEPAKVSPGVLSTLEIPNTSTNRLMVGHGAKMRDGKIYLEQRLVPQTSKRQIKPVKRLDL